MFEASEHNDDLAAEAQLAGPSSTPTNPPPTEEHADPSELLPNFQRYAEYIGKDWEKYGDMDGMDFEPGEATQMERTSFVYLKLVKDLEKDRAQDQDPENKRRFFLDLIQDFGHWERKDWDTVHTIIRKAFRDRIVQRGFPVEEGRKKKIAQTLAEFITAAAEEQDRSTAARKQQGLNMFGEPTTQTARVARVEPPQAPAPAVVSDQTAQTIQQLSFHPEAVRQSVEQPQQHTTYQYRNVPITPIRQMNPSRPFSQSRPEASHRFREGTFDTDFRPPVSTNFSKALGTLIKLTPADRQYSGSDQYESMAQKILSFKTTSRYAGLEQRELPDAFGVLLKGRALEFYETNLQGRNLSLENLAVAIQNEFETSARRGRLTDEWNDLSFQSIVTANSGKQTTEQVDLLIDQIKKLSRVLPEYESDQMKTDALRRACRYAPSLYAAFVLDNAEKTFEGMCATVRATAEYELRKQQRAPSNQYLTERRYNGGSSNRNKSRTPQPAVRKCWVCSKEGCWSRNHPKQDQDAAYQRYKDAAQSRGKTPTSRAYVAFLTEREGEAEQSSEESDDEIGKIIEATHSMEEEHSMYFASIQKSLNGPEEIQKLNNQALLHGLNGHSTAEAWFEQTNFWSDQTDPVNNQPLEATETEYGATYLLDDRPEETFYGFLPDTGAADISTAGKEQVLALLRLLPSLRVRQIRQERRVRFGKGSTDVTGEVTVETPIGTITFMVVPINTPFLICLQDLKQLGVTYDIPNDLLLQQTPTGKRKVHLRLQWGHPWIVWDTPNEYSTYMLTAEEMHRLHRRFGHPSVEKLSKLLDRAGEEFDRATLTAINELCHQCQTHGPAPRRFRFALRDDIDFNAEVEIDICWIEREPGNKQPVLHLVDRATAFQAARFLSDQTADTVWRTLKAMWIDTYLGPPDVIIHDAGKNFSSVEFKNNAHFMQVQTIEVPVEAHNSIGKTERYHAVIRRAYEIISRDVPDGKPEEILQMAVKSVNDTAGPDGLVPTLLVFGAYPRLSNNSPPSASVQKRGEAVQKAMKEVRKLKAERQVAEALAKRNGNDVSKTLKLPIGAKVLVWRESGKWTGPFSLLSISNTTGVVNLPSGPTQFRVSSIKPYYGTPDFEEQEDGSSTASPDSTEGPSADSITVQTDQPSDQTTQEPNPRRRGRPKGSKNQTFLSAKEVSDAQLSHDLREKGIIKTEGRPFEKSLNNEWDSLLDRVVVLEQYDQTIHGSLRIFKSRVVNEVKGKTTDAPYEKSRIVVMGYNDQEKHELLTQAPTIQRMSQRLIVALAPSLMKKGLKLRLRDITQAYTQAKTPLARTVYARLPKELQERYGKDRIMKVIRPLYGLAESGNHWWATYSKHHQENLRMKSSTYDPCLMITQPGDDAISITGMQTDDTLELSNDVFDERERKELLKAEFPAKEKTVLSGDPLIFNGCTAEKRGEDLYLRPKGQARQLRLVDHTAPSVRSDYRAQRARGAYIAMTCQPEAQFDLAIAAQVTEPSRPETKKLNARIQWQIDNPDRGLLFKPLTLEEMKLFVFVDASFANNYDLTSQIGFVIAIGTEEAYDQTSRRITANVVHWNSSKCKRVTRSVLASEIYAMSGGLDIGIALGTTLDQIMKLFGITHRPIVLCTDSYSLYECLVKLGTTKEKRLMIDIMGIREAYERRDVDEVRWIKGDDNPADAMTKERPNRALTELVETGQLTVGTQGWVQR